MLSFSNLSVVSFMTFLINMKCFNLKHWQHLVHFKHFSISYSNCPTESEVFTYHKSLLIQGNKTQLRNINLHIIWWIKKNHNHNKLKKYVSGKKKIFVPCHLLFWHSSFKAKRKIKQTEIFFSPRLNSPILKKGTLLIAEIIGNTAGF